jgi:CHAT domain-containing protein/tetratricopeptide (TPR) repeat protein
MRFALHQYRGALDSFLEARRMAVEMGDASQTASMDANLSSLYMEMGDLEEASRRMQGTLERLSGRQREEHFAETEILLANLRARQHRMPEALPLFHDGIQRADTQENWKLAAFAWNRIGEEYLKHGDLDAAERPLLEAYRIRKLRGFALDTSYRNLGRLRLEQGDLDAAESLLNHAVELAARPDGPIPSWDAYHYRGRVRLAQGRLTEAISDLRTAVRLARAWRWSAPPDDAMRIGAEGWLDRVYGALIDAGNQLYQRTHDLSLIRETFEAAEENRANSLRTLIEGRIAAAEELPESYWPAVSRLQRSEVEAARLRTPAAEQEALSARAALAQIEADAFHVPLQGSEGLLARLQSQLGSGDAAVAFHLGKSQSWAWAVDRTQIQVYPLPSRTEIDSMTRAFAEAVHSGSAQEPKTGETLYRTLFGALVENFQTKGRWLLALDGSLFDVPFAALPSGDSNRPSTQAGRRVIEVIPGAALWTNRPPSSGSGSFLGVGDAVYNLADPRLGGAFRAHIPSNAARTLAPLPRLAASAAELEISAGAWNGNHSLLEGLSASRASLAASLAKSPSVIHFATHFVQSAGANPQSSIVLSLDGSGHAETIEPAEIARWRVNAELVALSGCNSSAGAVLPGAGLLGLTRAWLAAGAHNILASHWEVPDDGGPMFAAFYRHLGSAGETPASALRAAQAEMAESGGWRANPRYWAAYFVMGKE